MLTAAQTVVPHRMLGKRVFFQGRFGRSYECIKQKLRAMAEAQQAQVAAALDASVDYVVVPEVAAKSITSKVQSLNRRGAAIELIDGEHFRKLVELTEGDVVALIRSGGKMAAEIMRKALDHPAPWHYITQRRTPAFCIEGKRFDGVDLSGFVFNEVSFARCSFAGACCRGACFPSAINCDFSGAAASGAKFGNVAGSRFAGARMDGAQIEGDLDGADFTSAILDGARLSEGLYASSRPQGQSMAGVILSRASLRDARAWGFFDSPDLAGADLSAAILGGSYVDADFRDAKLCGARLVGCKLPQANFSGADLRGANLADADLSGSTVDGADLANANLLGAKLNGVDLSKARNLGPDPRGRIGPAMRELESVVAKRPRLRVEFMVRQDNADDGARVGIDTYRLSGGWGLCLSQSISRGYTYGCPTRRSICDALLQLAAMTAPRQVLYETLSVKVIKAPKRLRPLLWELVLRSIAEAFAQPAGDVKELAAASKAYRRRKAAEANQEKQVKAAEEAQRIARMVQPVHDMQSLLRALDVRIDRTRIRKAKSMLKASKFQLYSDLSDRYLAGVVKSQTDPDLVYACRIDHEGHYACCTQNLNICGGLRGSICKHLLVLIIGLVKAGELDPATIDQWIAKTHSAKPELDKEKMGDIFIRYKGAEAGEVDWRPTETLPEDYYAL